MRKWLIDILIRRSDRKWIAERLDLLLGIDDAITRIRQKDSVEKYEILTLAVKKLFNTVDADDILHVNEYGQWMFEGRPMLDAEVKALIEEAKTFQAMKLYRVLITDMKYQANKRMYVKSETILDLVAGKLLVWLIDVIKDRLKKMSEVKIKQ